ncbi:toxic anion resistance protein [Undibacterium fentianense]|uniref:Toxic anion resistance protein n=1 Tax=Undibacterium fentianense TaxID=2828728 RepID=A0A941E4N2_9BURK|nr:toxic anion resistance protein [Undibacterium fentianense]MBR7801112.1 toxic anion resistance protein [Undibacterium fentianense]
MKDHTTSPLNSQFVLQAPEVITPVSEQVAKAAVPLSADMKNAVEDQVEHFMQALLSEDLQSESFKTRLDSAFALGREEISIASGLMQGRLLQTNFIGMEDSSAFKAIQEMREHLDQLNPGKEGDLFQPKKLLGLIPYGNKLQSYFRRYQGAASQLQKSMQQLYAARDDMQRDVLDIEATRAKLWEAMQKLNGAIYFAETLDRRLHERVLALKAHDSVRAQALEQEVLFYARQNLQDMLTQQAVCTNGYLALDVLKKTGREMMNGCSRVATTGMSALAVAQTLARATGNQIKVMDALTGINQTVESLIGETGRLLNQHTDRLGQFAQNPMVGIDKLKEMFDQTFKAMDAMDTFKSKAIDVMGQNNHIIQQQLEKAEQYLDKHRQHQVREASRTEIAGPVAL